MVSSHHSNWFRSMRNWSLRWNSNRRCPSNDLFPNRNCYCCLGNCFPMTSQHRMIHQNRLKSQNPMKNLRRTGHYLKTTLLPMECQFRMTNHLQRKCPHPKSYHCSLANRDCSNCSASCSFHFHLQTHRMSLTEVMRQSQRGLHFGQTATSWKKSSLRSSSVFQDCCRRDSPNFARD